jgi:hypothetical protein
MIKRTKSILSGTFGIQKIFSFEKFPIRMGCETSDNKSDGVCYE